MADLDDLAKAARQQSFPKPPSSPPAIPYAAPQPAFAMAPPVRAKRKWWLFPVLMASWSGLMLVLFLAVSVAGLTGANSKPAPQTPYEQMQQKMNDEIDAQHPSEVAADKAAAEGAVIFGGALCFGTFWFVGMLGLGIMWMIYGLKK